MKPEESVQPSPGFTTVWGFMCNIMTARSPAPGNHGIENSQSPKNGPTHTAKKNQVGKGPNRPGSQSASTSSTAAQRPQIRQASASTYHGPPSRPPAPRGRGPYLSGSVLYFKHPAECQGKLAPQTLAEIANERSLRHQWALEYASVRTG